MSDTGATTSVYPVTVSKAVLGHREEIKKDVRRLADMEILRQTAEGGPKVQRISDETISDLMMVAFRNFQKKVDGEWKSRRSR